MSLGICIKSPEGIILSAESRVTLSAAQPGGALIHVHYDNAIKLFGFSAPHTYVGVVTWGAGAINLRTAHSFQPEFEATLPTDRLPVLKYAELLRDFYMGQWNAAVVGPYAGPPMTFIVAGFDEGQPYGRVFEVNIPTIPGPVEHQPKAGDFGLSWGGQREIVDRLMQGFDARVLGIVKAILPMTPQQEHQIVVALTQLQLPVPLQAMPLQDCIDLALFFIKSTIDAQKLAVQVRGCGGFVDLATITRRDGFSFIQRKQIQGERRGG